jgi:hypothetical protein
MRRRLSLGSASQRPVQGKLRRCHSLEGISRRSTLQLIYQRLSFCVEALRGASENYDAEHIHLAKDPFIWGSTGGVALRPDLWKEWLADPLLVPNSQLSRMLELVECTKTSPLPPTCTGGHITYFRSWELSRAQFGRIIDAMFSVETQIDELSASDQLRASAWHYALKRSKGNAVFTIRYVGTTLWPATPWKRMTQANERKGSLVSAFSAYVQKYTPENAFPKVFAIVGTFVPKASDNQLYRKGLEELAYGYERFFISFFRPNTLLNRQPGGKSNVHHHDVEVETVFLRSQTALISQLDMCRLTQSTKVKADVTKSFNLWWEYAHKSIFSVNYPVPSGSYIASTYTQALPQEVEGACLAVICGEDPPEKTLKDAAPFLAGARGTSDLVISVLSYLASLECGKIYANIQNLRDIFGFNQLFNLPKLDNAQKQKSYVRSQ